MEKPKIIAYLKTGLRLEQRVRAVLRKYDLPFEDRTSSTTRSNARKWLKKSGQSSVRAFEIDGQMLADISGEGSRIVDYWEQGSCSRTIS